MKYLITESRLKDLIFKFLNSKDWVKLDVGDEQFDLSDGYKSKSLINYRIIYNTVTKNTKERLYIDKFLIQDIQNIFSLKFYEVSKYIVDWFNLKYHKNVDVGNWDISYRNV